MVGVQVQEVPAASVPEGAWLLDVREDDEWAAGYAPGARHIPLGELGARSDEIPRSEAVYVICRSGHRSGRAAQALANAGWDAINVAGGMQDWAAAGRLMATDSGAEPFVA
jgi:rhodanese-related sulfurtransferase